MGLATSDLSDEEEKLKAYTLEEFSYDHFRSVSSTTWVHVSLQWGGIHMLLHLLDLLLRTL